MSRRSDKRAARAARAHRPVSMTALSINPSGGAEILASGEHPHRRSNQVISRGIHYRGHASCQGAIAVSRSHPVPVPPIAY